MPYWKLVCESTPIWQTFLLVAQCWRWVGGPPEAILPVQEHVCLPFCFRHVWL